MNAGGEGQGVTGTGKPEVVATRAWPHHGFADLLPLIHGPEFDALVDDIREHGLRVPIVLFEGQVLDGRNRLRACRAAGVEPRFEEFGGTEDDALNYVVSLNVARRHLTTPQRAALALRLLPVEAERARRRMEAGVADPTQDSAEGPANGEATELAGRRVGISKETVRQAARIAEHAPDVVDAMSDGLVRSLPEAQRLAHIPRQQRPAVTEHLRAHGGKVYDAVRAIRSEEHAARVDEAPTPTVVRAPGVTLLYGQHVLDALRQLDEGTAHSVITSPPYWGSLRDYGGPPVAWSDGWSGHLGGEPTVQMYVEHLVAVFDAIRRVLRHDGTAWLVLGDNYVVPSNAHGALKPKDLALVPHRVALALQSAGWWVRQDVVFAKTNPMPEPVTDRPTRAHEFVFQLAHPDGDGTYYYDGAAVLEPFVDGHPKTDRRGRQRGVGGRGDGHTRPHGINPRPNERGRNRRSVWTMPTQSGDGHIAAMPEALVEPMILAGTSATGACAACGTPWTRQVRRGDPVGPSGRSAHSAAYGDASRTGRPGRQVGVGAAGTAGKGFGVSEVETTGWQPPCDCDTAEVVPCTVLDPFSGAATTGMVARKHGRSFIGIDLNAGYLDLAKKRIGIE